MIVELSVQSSVKKADVQRLLKEILNHVVTKLL